MTELPDWMRPPREEGWFAEDLDRLAEAPRHTEVVDGYLVFMLWPRPWWHSRLVTELAVALMAQAPAGVRVGGEMTVRLDERNRPEPDLGRGPARRRGRLPGVRPPGPYGQTP